MKQIFIKSYYLIEHDTLIRLWLNDKGVWWSFEHHNHNGTPEWLFGPFESHGAATLHARTNLLNPKIFFESSHEHRVKV